MNKIQSTTSQKKLRIAVCPGSFDPITNGHLDIIERGCTLFDRVVVLVALNVKKQTAFSVEQRISWIETCTKHLPQVSVDSFDGLLTNYLFSIGAVTILKGLRAMSDFEHEFSQALANQRLAPHAETVFLTTSAENMFISSSLVKEVATLGGDLSGFVPTQIAATISGALRSQ